MSSLVDYDSDSSPEDAPPQPSGRPTLPSAAALLASDVRPDFLPSAEERGEVDYRQLGQRLQSREAARSEAAAAAADLAAATSDAAATKASAAPVVAGAGALSTLAASAPGQPPPRATPPAAARASAGAGAKRGAERGPDAKERAKHQRLTGQSGIGEDFKTWRTEQEMQLRQHYDG